MNNNDNNNNNLFKYLFDYIYENGEKKENKY